MLKLKRKRSDDQSEEDGRPSKRAGDNTLSYPKSRVPTVATKRGRASRLRKATANTDSDYQPKGESTEESSSADDDGSHEDEDAEDEDASDEQSSDDVTARRPVNPKLRSLPATAKLQKKSSGRAPNKYKNPHPLQLTDDQMEEYLDEDGRLTVRGVWLEIRITLTTHTACYCHRTRPPERFLQPEGRISDQYPWIDTCGRIQSQLKGRRTFVRSSPI